MAQRFVSIRILESDVELLSDGLDLLKPYRATTKEGQQPYCEYLKESIKNQAKRR